MSVSFTRVVAQTVSFSTVISFSSKLVWWKGETCVPCQSHIKSNCVGRSRTLAIRVPREIPRVAFWIPRDLKVWVPSWTGWHILPRSHVHSFSCPGTGIYFVTLVHRWNMYKHVCVYYSFVYRFSLSFQLSLFSWKSSILRKSDM